MFNVLRIRILQESFKEPPSLHPEAHAIRAGHSKWMPTSLRIRLLGLEMAGMAQLPMFLEGSLLGILVGGHYHLVRKDEHKGEHPKTLALNQLLLLPLLHARRGPRGRSAA